MWAKRVRAEVEALAQRRKLREALSFRHWLKNPSASKYQVKSKRSKEPPALSSALLTDKPRGVQHVCQELVVWSSRRIVLVVAHQFWGNSTLKEAASTGRGTRLKLLQKGLRWKCKLCSTVQPSDAKQTLVHGAYPPQPCPSSTHTLWQQGTPQSC